jgi:predicted porin
MKKLALASMVAAAAAVAAPAQAVTVMAEDGWTLGVSGSINQFVTFVNDDANSDQDYQGVANGLLPAFLSFDLKAPTVNGLDLAAHVSFSPGTNNTSGNAQEQREVYFTVDGSFGQVLMGKALGLYGSHNILSEQTIWGVGYAPAVGGGSTSLGGIGLGYDYAAWRSQVRYTTPDMNGFKAAVAVVQGGAADSRLSQNGGLPSGSFLNNVRASEDLRYEADLSYATQFDGGSFKGWVSAMMQDQDDLAEDKQAWTVGGNLTLGGFEFHAQYSDAEGAASNTTCTVVAGCGLIAYGSETDTASEKLEWDQYVVQAGYRFAGTTLVSANYSELTDDSPNRSATADESDRITLGIYHDVNSNLKLVAEYTKVENDNNDVLDQDIFSLGGFMFF